MNKTASRNQLNDSRESRQKGKRVESKIKSNWWIRFFCSSTREKNQMMIWFFFPSVVLKKNSKHNWVKRFLFVHTQTNKSSDWKESKCKHKWIKWFFGGTQIIPVGIIWVPKKSFDSVLTQINQIIFPIYTWKESIYNWFKWWSWH